MNQRFHNFWMEKLCWLLMSWRFKQWGSQISRLFTEKVFRRQFAVLFILEFSQIMEMVKIPLDMRLPKADFDTSGHLKQTTRKQSPLNDWLKRTDSKYSKRRISIEDVPLTSRGWFWRDKHLQLLTCNFSFVS